MSAAPEFEPSGFSRNRQQALADLEERHFWFKPRDRLVSRIIAKLAPGRFAAAVELGCGSGRMLPTLKSFADELVGIDGFLASLDRAAKRSSGATLIHGDVTATPLGSEQFDLLVALDVLEHVDSGTFLSEVSRLARPNSRLVLSVPAYAFLWSEADTVAGHRCRYSPQQLGDELRAHGWTPLGRTFYQTFLFPLMILTRRIAPRQLRKTERCPPAPVGALLGAVNSLEVELSSRVPMPFGSTLIAWARR